ncbi:MAG TPA: HEAT repeat domain-containing protein [Acidobacteriaceae bacterium]|nr:HEAT repeat domain-containing protein [Acidobacteriaceae bacterium]
MNCQMAQEDIVLAVYGELPDDRAHQLEQHLAQCDRCRQEMEAISGLQKAMSVLPVEEPTPSLLARTRLRLDEALDALPHGGFLLRRWQSFLRGFGRLQSAPIMASALLVLGLGAGTWGGYRAGVRAAAKPTAASQDASASGVPVMPDLDESQIAGVSSITLEPNTENVEVRFNRVVPETAFGTLDDPQIRQLLLMGARNPDNPDVHVSSVDLLAQECQNGHECTGGPIRNALMVALRYDKNSKVRSKALVGLEPYIAMDTRVRDAVLEALMNDPDPEIRSQAIDQLAPVDADSSVREVLQTVASQDQNPHIRTVSREYLERVSQIQ